MAECLYIEEAKEGGGEGEKKKKQKKQKQQQLSLGEHLIKVQKEEHGDFKNDPVRLAALYFLD